MPMYIYVYEHYGEDNRKSRDLMYQALKMYAAEVGIPIENSPKVIKIGKGKPVFAEYCNINFSISHWEKFWTCCFSEKNLGFDIQGEKDAKIIEIARRYFSESEYKYILENGKRGFFRLWTMKEALAKFLGNGIADVMGKYRLVANGEITDRIDIGKEKLFFGTLDLEKHFSISDNVSGISCSYVSAEKDGELWVRKIPQRRMLQE